MAGGFPFNTRNFQTQMPDLVKPTAGGLSSNELPKVGLLADVYLAIRGTISGLSAAPNALGKASVVRGVKVSLNSSTDLFSVSGAGYHYILRDHLDSEYIDVAGQSDARSVVANGTFNLDMVIPIAVNPRDSIGLIMLQNESTVVQLQVDWEADANLGTGVTYTATATPYLNLFTVPNAVEDYPNLFMLHQILEDRRAVPSAADYTYDIPRANVYLQLLHGLGIAQAGTDAWTAYKLRVNQAQYLYSADIKYWDIINRRFRGRARVPGVIPVDLMAPSGLGTYGVSRDLFNSALVTDISSVITPTGANTLYTIRRQLVPLRG